MVGVPAGQEPSSLIDSETHDGQASEDSIYAIIPSMTDFSAMRHSSAARWVQRGILLLVVIIPVSAQAGAWAQEDLGLYTKLTASHSRAAKQYKSGGETFQLLSANEKGEYRSSALFVYGEFGLLPNLTVIGATSLRQSTVESDFVEIRTTGLSDVRFGAKYQFLDSPVVAAIQSMATLPTGYTADPANVATPTLGLGVFQWEARALVGRSFYPIPLYATGSIGIRHRGERTTSAGSRVDYPPQLPYRLEVGYTPLDWLNVRGLFTGVHGFGEPEALEAFSLTPLVESYMKVGPSVILAVADHVQINLDVMQTVSGVNTIRSLDVSAGIALDYTLGPTPPDGD